jgi:hypothetical protein
MTPNINKTLVGLPRLDELDNEPFELRARMVRLPEPPPRSVTHVRLRVQPPPAPASRLEPLNPAHFVVAILVMATIALVMQVAL